jgi:RNA polymerase sigma factor (sigma-70 family)
MADIGLDDAALGARVQSGDDEAFAQLYERYMPRLYDFAARLVRDPAAAEDLVQTTFVRAYERRETLRDPAKVRSWLYATAHNLAMNHLTRRTPEPVEEQFDLAAPGRGPEGEALAHDAAELVWDAAASLEPRQYAVLDLSVRQGLTTPEIAEVLGLPTAHTAVLVNRAREALGSAVRYLMVARRRDHCERLAHLVPAGVRSLTSEQRSTVDHHMRHCENCQLVARQLTQPAELFGGLVLLPIPEDLTRWSPLHGRGGEHLTRGAHHLATRHGGQAIPRSRGLGRTRWSRPIAGLPAPGVAAAAAVVLVGAIGAGVLAIRAGSPRLSPSVSSPRTTATPLSLSHVVGAQFTRVPPASLAAAPSEYFGAACPSATTCYVVGDGWKTGQVVTLTHDGGTTWSTSYFPGLQFTAISCPTVRDCFAGGSNAVYVTHDGARSWTAQSVPPNVGIESVSCPSIHDCLAVGDSIDIGKRIVLATTDGGASWLSRSSPTESWLARAHCLDRSHCWVLGWGGWFTSDLGATWRAIDLPGVCFSAVGSCGSEPVFLDDVDFASANDGWVAGTVLCGNNAGCSTSYVAHTLDGGRAWSRQDAGGAGAMTDQITCSRNTCLMSVGVVVVVTTSGGSTWREFQQVSATSVWSLACDPSGAVCVVAGENRPSIHDATPVLLVDRGV